MTETLARTETAYEALALIDSTIADLRGVNIAEASKMTDILLDLRLLVDRIISEF